MSRSFPDAILVRVLRLLAFLSGCIVLFVFLHLVLEAWPALETPGLRRFLTDDAWRPAGGPPDARYGFAPMVVGSLAATLGAMLLAAPLGYCSAVFCHQCAPPRLRGAYRRIVELLAGIPSVVYGLWGLVTLAPLVRAIEPPGPSLLTGSLVLGLMILPTVALLADAAFASVPRAQLQAAAAVSLSRWRTLLAVHLPQARPGLWGALLLGTARALGETMAVLMVCGNVIQVPKSVFNPVRTLTADIALELGYATGTHRSALFVLWLFLMGAVVVLVAAAELLGSNRARA